MMEDVNPNKIIHESFIVGIILKGFNALLEIIAAVGLFFLTSNRAIQAMSALTAKELLEDPQDKLANFLLHSAPLLITNSRLFIFIYLLSHGIIKLFLVLALLKRYHWAYPSAITVFSGFAIYQLYRYTHTHSVWLLILTVFDVLIIILAWFEYNYMKRFVWQKQ